MTATPSTPGPDRPEPTPPPTDAPPDAAASPSAGSYPTPATPAAPATPAVPAAGPAGGPAAATSTGLDPKVAGLLAYLVGWVSGLILYLIEKDHREVRFHAAQSILVSIALIGAYIALSVISLVPVVGWLIGLLGTIVVAFAGLGLWVYLLVQGYNLKHTRLPVVGKMAEQWAAK